MQNTTKVLAISVISTTLTAISSPVLSATIGVFNNPSYVISDWSNNLITVLKNQGNTVTEFTSFDAVVWQQIAEDNQLIVIPTQDQVYENLPNDTQNVIKNYVATGGGFISVGLLPDSVTILNGLFGWNIQEKYIVGDSFLNSTAATGTIFASGPSQLLAILAIGKVDGTTLPTGGLNLYATAGTSTTLFVAPYNQGRVGFIGLDFSDITGDSNWLTVTNTTVQYVAKTSPEPSNIVALLTLGLLGLKKKKIRVKN